MSIANGSIWRKWDLHVHTPSSYYSQYPDDWDLFVKELIKSIKKHEIAAIATADYFTIEGYSKLLTYYDKATSTLSIGAERVEVCIIPGIELRLNIFNSHDESINYHVLFDPEICTVDFIKDNFLEKLQITYRGETFPLKERTLIAIGYSIVENKPLKIYDNYSGISEEFKSKYLKAAYSTVSLSQTDINSSSKAISEAMEFNGRSKKPFLKIIAGKGHGSLKKLKWFEENQQFSRAGLTRESLTNVTDMVFSNDVDDINFYLGLHSKTSVEEVKQRFGALKACVWGSDCHSLGNMLHPSNGNSNDYTWIKADPCFEGLRQVVFEPAERVVIQETVPQLKFDYLIIDQISFKSDSSNKFFSLNPIPLNSNLNTIIGGKSSGKSLLLYHIAKAIDPQQVKEKMEIVGVKAYGFEKQIPAFDFVVKWRDGYTNSLSDLENKLRKVTYIPQMYINHLAEEKGEQKLKELIEGILQQNHDLKTFWDTNKAKIKQKRLEIFNVINGIYSVRESVKETSQKIKDIGDKTGINNTVARIKVDINKLRLQTGFTIEENKEYGRLTALKEFGISKANRYVAYEGFVKTYVQTLEESKQNTLDGMTAFLDFYVQQNDDMIAVTFANGEIADDIQVLRSCFENIIKKREELEEKFLVKIINEESKIAKIDSQLAPFLTKIGNQNLLKQLNDQLTKEQEKIKQIDELEKIYNEQVLNGRSLKIKLIEIKLVNIILLFN